ncbi:MAG: hypothetical protein HY331_17330, partial [Chloroflexi bacterium]|nr:hypothetical protein [Chloroflexota bacterium]
MRVALDVSAAIHQTAGIARYCVELARSLQATAADGDEIALFYVGDGPSPRLASLGDPLPHGGRGDRLDRESRETTRQARIEGPPATRRVFSLSRLSRRFGSFRGPNVSPLPPSGRGAGG